MISLLSKLLCFNVKIFVFRFVDTSILHARMSHNAMELKRNKIVEIYDFLTHLSLVPHICVNEPGQHWFRWWLVAYSAPSHYLNQCWLIVNWTLRNKLQWNPNQNAKLVIQENASENIVCEKAAILSKGRCLCSIIHKALPAWEDDSPTDWRPPELSHTVFVW